MKIYLVSVVVLLAVICANIAVGHDEVVEKPIDSQTLDSFNQESAKIREQMLPGGVYASIRSSDKARVESRMNTMLKLLQSHPSISDLSQADKVVMFNAQEEVNAILRRNDRNRMVCDKRVSSGSHIPVTVCQTYGEAEEARRASLNQLNEMQNLSRAANTH